MATVKDHELASLFPLMSDEETNVLAEDIKANGQRDKIVLLDGKILDGRNRYRACRLAKAEPEFKVYKGTDPLGFVVSVNLHRRHLTEGQRAMVAANIATAKVGNPSYSANLPNSKNTEKTANKPVVTQPEAAKLLNVSERSVRDAKKVVDEAEPEIVKAVESGKLPVSTAAKVADLPEKTQRDIAAAESPKKAAKKAIDEAECDPIDRVLDSIKSLVKLTDGVKRELEGNKDPLFVKFVHVQSIAYQFHAARSALWQSRPTEPCNCMKGGNAKADCRACHGCGKCPVSRVLKGGK